MIPARPVIPSGQDHVLTELLRVDPHESGGWTLRGFQAMAHVIRARYAHPRRGEIVLELGHPAHMPRALSTTERFGIAFSDVPHPTELLDALSRRLASRESNFAWSEPKPPRRAEPRPAPRPSFTDIERLAFEAGVKPALRVHLPPERADGIVASFERFGHATAQFRTRVPRRHLLFVAHRSDAAERLAELERTISRDVFLRTRRSVDAVRECGLLLGYPSCCAERFAERYRRSPHPLLPRQQSLAYVAARAAWVREPQFRLNDALVAQGSCYISFEPCRYDCTEAFRHAALVAEVVGARTPELRETIDAELRRDVLIVESGERAVIEIAGGVITALAPLPAPQRATLGNAGLGAMIGSRVRADGSVARRPGALVIRFGRPV